METKQKQVYVLTPEKEAELRRVQQQIADELPELIEQDKTLKRASEEPTLSGQLRRAIHTCRILPHQVAARSGISRDELHDFLMGDLILPSNVIDRLAEVAGCELKHVSQD